MFLTSFPGQVLAHDHRPPRAYLLEHGETQRGRTVHLVSTEPGSPSVCASYADEYPFGFPRPLPVRAGELTFGIEFKTQHRPTGLKIRSWTELDEAGRPVGRAQTVDYSLRRLRQGGRVTAWRARVSELVSTDLYMLVEGTWPDRNCGGGKQRVDWTFHLSAVK